MAKILIVDDDSTLRQAVTVLLTRHGCEVSSAGGGREAIELLTDGGFDVVITDLKMDGMDGMTLFKHVHSRNPSLPVLILTAHGTIPDAFEAANQGVFAYLTKPFDSKVLLEHVSRALGTTSQSLAG